MGDAAHDGAWSAGVEVPAVTRWFEGHVPGVRPPLDFELIAGGYSMMTFKVVDADGGVWILRRPPLRHLLPTAHDVGREYRVMSALADSRVPLPHIFGFCDDTAVTGAPFYVMEFVAGAVLHDRATAEGWLDEAGRRRAGVHLIDILVDLHSVDPDAVGLTTLGKKEAYLARQVHRWYKQFELSKTRELPLLASLRDELVARMPPQTEATIVHGDFRLGNCICDRGGNIKAVLDWEVCTLGDPLADISYVVAMWPHPEDPYPQGESGATMAAGFPRQQELLERYAAGSDRDLSGIGYYLAFHFWRMACINEEVHARYLGGAYGEPQVMTAIRDSVEYFAGLGRDVLATVR
jgi:aminoglycoside phosphotransferase (APT) family kinase protein